MSLWAVNERTALYRNERGAIAGGDFDPFKFIDGLLSVRTASGLISFLADENTENYADILVFDKHLLDSHSDPGLEPLYDRGDLIKSASKWGIDELDRLTEIDGIDLSSEWPDRSIDWKKIDLDCLRVMKGYLTATFTATAVACGDQPPEGFLKVVEPSDEPWSGYVHLDFSNIRLSPPAKLWEGGFRDPCDQDYLMFADDYLPYDLEEGDSLVIDDRIIQLNFDSISTAEAIRSVCASAVSFAILHSRDNEYSDRLNRYNFSLKESRFTCEEPMPTALARVIMDEAIRLILSRRVALCKVCKRPFVMAYEKGRSTSRRMTCSGSCRTKLYRETSLG